MKHIPLILWTLCWSIIALLAMEQPASLHGGRLNGEGCHNNRRTGGYHCHRSYGSRRSSTRTSGSSSSRTSPKPRGQQSSKITIDTLPRAEIWVDNKKIGMAPIKRYTLKDSTTFTLKHPVFGTHTHTVSLGNTTDEVLIVW